MRLWFLKGTRLLGDTWSVPGLRQEMYNIGLDLFSSPKTGRSLVFCQNKTGVNRNKLSVAPNRTFSISIKITTI